MARLKVVDPANPEADLTMAEALEGLVRECLASSPSTIMMVWTHGTQMTTKSIPESPVLKKGFVNELWEQLYCPDEDEE